MSSSEIQAFRSSPMKKRITAIGILAFTAGALFCIPLWAQQASTPDSNAQNAALEQRIRDLEDRVISLEGKIRTMQSAQPAHPPPPHPAQAAQGAQNPVLAAAQATPPPTPPAMPSPNET